jgi:hypothetical protein
VAGIALASCDADGVGTRLSRQELIDPASCKSCHAGHYREWAGSMHAYASRDPVFRAMNRRGQEETNGALGSFCVNCHAPMAVREGATVDGLNLAEVPDSLQGVGCYFCHNVVEVEGTHNNALRIANDTTMRGRIADPVANPAHRSAPSPLFSGAEAASAKLCGACHDLVLPSPPAPAAVELERTFREWSASVFAPEQAPVPSALATCNACHMPSTGRPEPVAEGPGLAVVARSRHLHHLAALDTALDDFPRTGDAAEDALILGEQLDHVQRLLDGTLRLDICVQVQGDGSAIEITLDNANAGHNWPSGASQDRRAWVEVIAYRAGAVVYRSGAVPPDEQVPTERDPDLWELRDHTFDAQGQEAHMFWQVARVEPGTIGAQVTNNPADARFYTASHAIRRFPADRSAFIPGIVDRVTARVRVRPIGLDILDDLVRSGHLDRAIRDRMPTFDLLPNRALGAARPEYASLAAVSMEWSEATHRAPVFYVRQDFSVRPPKDCVGMPRQP